MLLEVHALIPIGYCSSCASNMPVFNPLSLRPSVVLQHSSRVVPIDMHAKPCTSAFSLLTRELIETWVCLLTVRGWRHRKTAENFNRSWD